jgi:hypothetical protein
MVTISKVGSLVKIEHEGGTSFVSQSDRPYFRHTTATGKLTLRIGEVRIEENLLSNYTIEGVVPSDVDELETQLIAVFPNANSGSGGSGGAPTILQSPDNTLWAVGVNDAGVLQTTQVAEGVAGTLHLFSPDNTEWNVTVNDLGALTTTAI